MHGGLMFGIGVLLAFVTWGAILWFSLRPILLP